MLDRDSGPRTADPESELEQTQDWPGRSMFSPRVSPENGPANTRLQASPVAVGGAYRVSTQDVLDVLGDDADELLASSRLEMGELVQLLNAETMYLPRIDADMEREIEEALAGGGYDGNDHADEYDDAEYDEDGEQPAPRRARTIAADSPWRKRFLRAAIGAVLLTAAGGGVAAAAMNKTVNVDVDGHTETVHTFSSTVGGVLDKEGLHAGPHDALSPSPSAQVADGGTVTLDRGRQLSLTVDGVAQQHWVHSGTLGSALRALHVDTSNMWLSQSPDAQVPLGGATVELKTLKNVTLIDGAAKPRPLQTHAVTVGELLRSLNINLAKGDAVSPGNDVKLTSGAQVMISRTGIQVINKSVQIDPPVQKVNDDSMYEGETKVVDKGTPGTKIVTYRITSVNGKESKREQLAVKQVSAPRPQIVHVGTKQRPESADNTSAGGGSTANAGLWDQIAGCESSGNWSTNTGNGYYGGLQFDRSTWLSNGGGQYASTADKASKSQQIAVANRVKAARGLSPWQCAGELGLD